MTDNIFLQCQNMREVLLKPAKVARYTSAHGVHYTPWDAFDAYALSVQEHLEKRAPFTALSILETLCDVFFDHWYIDSVEMSDYGDEAAEFVTYLSGLCQWQLELDKYGQAEYISGAVNVLELISER